MQIRSCQRDTPHPYPQPKVASEQRRDLPPPSPSPSPSPSPEIDVFAPSPRRPTLRALEPPPERPLQLEPSDIALCVSDDVAGESPSPLTVPIAQTSLFTYPDFPSLLDGLGAEHLHHVYSRGQNPTVE